MSKMRLRRCFGQYFWHFPDISSTLCHDSVFLGCPTFCPLQHRNTSGMIFQLHTQNNCFWVNCAILSALSVPTLASHLTHHLQNYDLHWDSNESHRPLTINGPFVGVAKTLLLANRALVPCWKRGGFDEAAKMTNLHSNLSNKGFAVQTLWKWRKRRQK